jgi:hypothetical protein
MQVIFLRHLSTVIAVTLAVGCTTPSREPARDRYVRYRCADKQEFGLTFQQHATRALLESGGWSEQLRSVSVPPGTEYGDGNVVLRLTRNGASVTRGGVTTHRDCKAIDGD